MTNRFKLVKLAAYWTKKVKIMTRATTENLYSRLDSALELLDRLQAENDQLRAENEQLKTENDRLTNDRKSVAKVLCSLSDRIAELEATSEPTVTTEQVATKSEPDQAPAPDKNDADTLYATVQTTDRELGTENYTPICHIRPKLDWTRDRFDAALYSLMRSDRIEVSSLQEANMYEPDQIDAGIPQNMGGCLFFITTL